MTRANLTSLAFVACLAYAPGAQAHICMDAPVSRIGPSCTFASAQKPGPCGINTRSTQYVTEFKPGETIMVAINETIDHPSHYRIAFNPTGSSFEDPTSKDDMSGKHPFVLLDGIMDETATKQMVKVTLPNMTCDKCTLQLIQVMYDKGGNGFGNDDIYYSCADIVLKGTPAATSDAGAASDAGASSDASAEKPVRPQPDAGSPPIDSPDASSTGHTGTAHDAGGGPGVVVGPIVADAGGGATAGTSPDAGGAAPDDGDDEGGCALGAKPSREPLSTRVMALVGLLALVIRRRQRG
jgi:Lytic polysaccharide mono-oxygenase, cellulose-degrading